MGIENIGIKIAQKTINTFGTSIKINGFARLKSIFINGQNYQNYEQIVRTCKRPILGNIPKELVGFIVQKYPKTQRGTIIKKIQESFGNSIPNLRNATMLIEQGKNASFDLALASKALKAGLSEILPLNSQIILTPVGSGCYGSVFRLRIVDNLGNNLMADRALKVYESASQSNLSLRVHGVMAEANSAFRFQHILGHKNNRQNFCRQEFFDLERGFSVAQFADEALPAVKSKIDFSSLGLLPRDFHEDNIVLNRIVDFGGVLANKDLCDKTVLKYYKKIMNRRNPQEKEQLLRRYLNLANNPRQPNREKIRLAIELSQKDSSLLFSDESLTIGECIMPQIKSLELIRPKKIDISFWKNKPKEAVIKGHKFEFPEIIKNKVDAYNELHGVGLEDVISKINLEIKEKAKLPKEFLIFGNMEKTIPETIIDNPFQKLKQNKFDALVNFKITDFPIGIAI